MVGLSQGYITSLQLFNILLELVMTYATCDSTVSIHIQGQFVNNLLLQMTSPYLQKAVKIFRH